MELQPSTFETCEILATMLASTPLLPHSWALCNNANAAAPETFTVDLIRDVAYVAFSGVQLLPLSGRDLVALEGEEVKELFQPLNRHLKEHQEAPMVDSGLLQIFLNMYTHQDLPQKMLRVMQKSKSIVLTGHSLGGAAATLCALWLLSLFQSQPKPTRQPLICITFGSPLVGNDSLSRAILRERWCGKFCHVVSNHDIMPRLLAAPLLSSLAPQLHVILRYWHLLMASPQFGKLATQLSQGEKDEVFRAVLAHLDVISNNDIKGAVRSQYWPFGNFFFCSGNGAICLENTTSVMKMLFLTLKTTAPNLSIEDHLNYGDYVKKIGAQHMEKKNFISECLPESSYEAGVALALQSSGISTQDEVARMAENSLRTARRMGQRPNLNAAKLAISLSKITPYRAEIEWYKTSCDKADDQLGYYDCFKRIDVSVRQSRVNMNRHKLATFWNRVINMWENNELPPDFDRRAKWVNASHFYKLLVEPLDIAEYYRRGEHIAHGHYLKHGRERRYEIFDKWWREREVIDEGNKQRMKYAGLTQDSCFWARLEEARELLENIKCEGDVGKLALIWKSLENFERYSRGLIETKEVSQDVVAKNSSYSLWAQELREWKLHV